MNNVKQLYASTDLMVTVKHKRSHTLYYTLLMVDETCETFKQRYICSHTVAAAEDNKMLMNFISMLCSQRRQKVIRGPL